EVVGETRENVTILDPERQGETHLRDQGFTVTPRATDMMRAKLVREIHSGDTVVFSGSLCAGATPDYLGQLIDVGLHAAGRVVVDSSGDALRQILAARRQIWLLKPNLEELQTLLGRDIPNTAAAVSSAARELLPHAQMVLVSRGAEGAVLVGNPSGITGHDDGPLTGKVNIAGSPVRTVGCGDYLVAGFLAELQAGHNRETALRWALSAASARAFSADQESLDSATVKANLHAVTVCAVSEPRP
ncbi:MAG: PfkB family carbohydrate kinase, partial [Phycisphaerae bacterium]